MLAGVAGGTAKYLGVDPTFVRLGFAALALFGGIGVLAYLVMAVVVPEDDGSGQPVSGRPPTWAIVLLALAALIVLPGPFIGFGDGPWFFGFGAFWLLATGRRRRPRLPRLARRMAGAGPAGGGVIVERAGFPCGEVGGHGGHGSALRGRRRDRAAARTPPRDRPAGVLRTLRAPSGSARSGAFAAATGSGEIVAGIVIALGVVLAGVALVGDAFRRTAPWLLGLALLLALPAGAVAAADVRFDGGIGERTYTPVSVDDIPADGYELGVGQMKIDLRQLELRRGETLDGPGQARPRPADRLRALGGLRYGARRGEGRRARWSAATRTRGRARSSTATRHPG